MPRATERQKFWNFSVGKRFSFRAACSGGETHGLEGKFDKKTLSRQVRSASDDTQTKHNFLLDLSLTLYILKNASIISHSGSDVISRI